MGKIIIIFLAKWIILSFLLISTSQADVDWNKPEQNIGLTLGMPVGAEALRYLSSICIDREGTPHIVLDNEELKHTYKSGNSWNAEEITPHYSGYYWDHVSMALDSSDNPHIAFTIENTNLNYTSKNGSLWNIEDLGISNVDIYLMLVIDSQDRPHICYKGDGLNYLYYNGVSWVNQKIDSDTNAGVDCTIALDSTGKPHIAYRMYDTSLIKYAFWDGVSWNIEDTGINGSYPYLALDSNNIPYIAYLNYASAYVSYIVKNKAEWQVVETGLGGPIRYAGFKSPGVLILLINSDDKLQIVYCYPGAESVGIFYNSWVGDHWDVSVIKPPLQPYSGWSANFFSAVLDGENNPHIFFFDINSGVFPGYITGTLDTTPPNNVSNFSITAGDTQNTLIWQDPSTSDLDGILIVRNTTGEFTAPQDGHFYSEGEQGPGGDWWRTASVSTQTYTDTGLTNGIRYYYKIYAYDEIPNHASGITVNGTPADTTSPDEVNNFQAIAGDGEVRLTWTNPTTSDFQGVRIQRKEGSVSTSYSDGTTVYDSTGTSVTDRGLTNGITYYYTAYTYDEVPNYSRGTTVAATPISSISPPDDIPPSDASNLQIDAGDSQVTLSWQDPRDTDLERILLVRNTTGIFPTPVDGTNYGNGISGEIGGYSINVTVGTQTYRDTRLTNNTRYYYKIYAYDEIPNYASGVTGSATPADTTAPDEVSNFQATAGDTKIRLSWTNPATSDFQEVRIQRKEGSAPASYTDDVIVYEGTGTSKTDIGLTNNTTYYYTAYTYDEVPNYSSGITVIATPQSVGGDGGNDGGDGGCFIATAVYGSPMAEEVKVLCNFRDTHLLTNQFGKKLVGFYYKVSPTLADFIARHELLKSIVKFILKPMIKLTEILPNPKPV